MFKEDMKILFLGTPEFAASTLDNLIKSGYKPSLIITSSDKRSGRGKKMQESPVSLLAKEKKIETLKPKKITEIKDRIKKESFDLAIISAYGQIVPQEILDMPSKGFLNLHPSLLPKHRGASPITQTIIDGDKETGATIMLLNDKMDEGPILKQKKINLTGKEFFQELSMKLISLGSDILIETIPLWVNGKIKAKEQDHCQATYTKIIKKEDGKINWRDPAYLIEREVRAYSIWPKSFSFYQDKKSGKKKTMTILDCEIQKQTDVGPFGPVGKTYMATNNKIAVQTGKDFLIIKRLQLENKKATDVEDFLNGNINFIGTILK